MCSRVETHAWYITLHPFEGGERGLWLLQFSLNFQFAFCWDFEKKDSFLVGISVVDFLK